MSEMQNNPVKAGEDERSPLAYMSIPMDPASIHSIESRFPVKITSGRTGKVVEIIIRRLTNHEKEIIAKDCVRIEEKLKGTEYERGIRAAMRVTTFCATSSWHVGGYTVLVEEMPVVIFNSKVITGPDDKFELTLLHELMHTVTEFGDKDPNSLDEAKHNILCYALLGIPIPGDHWMWAKYPDLKDKLLSLSADDETDKDTGTVEK